jgi:hypothetical protein
VKQEQRGGLTIQKVTLMRLPLLVTPSAVVALVRSSM